MKIIGYFHICQKGEWKRSFDMIFNYIKNYGLYDITSEIRLGIINDTGNIIENYRLNDSKFKVFFFGDSTLYERPTLLHMKNSCTTDGDDVYYWYLHTKGLRHFGKDRESYVIDWIKLLLYWNIRKWNLAIEKLKIHDTYGCNVLDQTFYSGNFWWATSKHINNLPSTIPEHYIAPEEWVFKINKNYCEIYSSYIEGEGHYNMNFPESNYMSNDELNKILPIDFYIDTYKIYHPNINYNNEDYINDYFLNGVHTNINYTRENINSNIIKKLNEQFDTEFYKNTYNLHNYSNEQLIVNWITIGQFEKRLINKDFYIPIDFDYTFYKSYYKDLNNFTNFQLLIHWNTIGIKENRIYNNLHRIPNNFNYIDYKNNYQDLSHMTEDELKYHWLEYGEKENRTYKKINYDIDYIFYRNYYDDLKSLSDKELLNHWLNHGKAEGRISKNNAPDDFNYKFYKNKYKDLKHFNNVELLNHWINYGSKEGRVYK